jgi:predicted DNA-binding protein (UPF0251 family)
MPRKKRCRNLEGPPCCSGFKPKGIPARFLDKVVVSLDEYESIRLADYMNLEHEEASVRLGVSRSVFTRLVDGARKKVGRALIEGAELVIEGGEYHFQKKLFRCLECYHLFDTGIDDPDVEQCPKCSSERIDNLNKYFGTRGQCQRHGIGSDE